MENSSLSISIRDVNNGVKTSEVCGLVSPIRTISSLDDWDNSPTNDATKPDLRREGDDTMVEEQNQVCFPYFATCCGHTGPH